MGSDETKTPPSNSSRTFPTRGVECAIHTWNAPPAPDGGAPDDAAAATNEPPRGVVVVYHGLLAHGRYPTVRYAAELLASGGYAVYAPDMPGHGESPGERGYVRSADDLVGHGVDAALYACGASRGGGGGDGGTGAPPSPLFLVGSSMGGAIALAVSRELKSRRRKGEPNLPEVRGAALLAPMLAISVAEPLRYTLLGLSYALPTAPLISSGASSPEAQYRDPLKRKECEEDPLSVKGGLRCASASACVELTKAIQSQMGEVDVPFLCMVANEDTVVDNSGSRELMERAVSDDKTMKEYDALHGLLCEPEPLLTTIHGDLLGWLKDRS